MGNFNHFCVMLDQSRDGVMTVDSVKRFADIIKKFGYDSIMLYTEDTYKVDNEPYFGYMRGAYSKDEIRSIDKYLRSIGMELIPCIQALAHFTNLVKLPHYRDIVDVNDILLIDEEKTYDLLEKIFKTLEDSFTSRYVNIGMDEAHMVGLGRYLDKHGFKNRTELLIKHLNRVCEIADKHGFKPVMWSDMFFRLASKGDYYNENVHVGNEVKEIMPKNIELAYWDYYHTNKHNYDYMIKSHLEFDKPVWFAGGAWSWSGFAPHNKYSLLTMEPAMRSVKEYGIKDVIITMWGDDGKECSFFSLLPSLLRIRMFADGIEDETIIKNKFMEIVGIAYDDFMLLDNLNYREFNDGKGLRENLAKCLFYQDPFFGFYDKNIENMIIDYKKYYTEIEKVNAGVEYKYLFECMAKLARVLELKYNIGNITRKAYRENNKDELKRIADTIYPELIKRVEEFYKSFREYWHKDNKSFGFEVHDARIGGLIQRLKSCRTTILEYLNGSLDKIEALDEDILNMIDEEGFMYNNVYDTLVTFSRLG